MPSWLARGEQEKAAGCRGDALSYKRGEMTALVAGIGYIGSMVAENLLSRGDRVIAIDNFFATERQVVADLSAKGNLDFVEGNVNSRETIERALRRS